MLFMYPADADTLFDIINRGYSRSNYETTDYETYLNDGNNFVKICRYSDALASYDRAINANPSFADARYNRGVILSDNLGQCEEAVASYDKAIDLDSNYATAWNNHGAALNEHGNYTEALASYDKAIDLDSNYATANRIGKLCSISKVNPHSSRMHQ